MSETYRIIFSASYVEIEVEVNKILRDFSNVTIFPMFVINGEMYQPIKYWA
jgi:hypothetical protein